MYKVNQLENKNQFVLYNKNYYIFQSYDTTIAKFNINTLETQLDKYIYNGSRTTMKHLYIFLKDYCCFSAPLNKKILLSLCEDKNIKRYKFKKLN
jgi:hypothetical protein